MSKPRCLILGGGGHARVLIDLMLDADLAEPCAVLDRDWAKHGQTLLDVPILGGDDRLAELIGGGVRHFVVGLGGTGNNGPRRRLFELGLQYLLRPLTLIHRSAVVSKHAAIAPGAQLLPGCIVNAGAEVGKNVIVNSGAIVEHDCIVEDHVHIASGARLASTVRVGEAAHVGAGATVRQCVCIGTRAVIGAGAVVVEDVEPDTVVVGVPARLLRRLAA